MHIDLTDKTAIVTGSTGGIGLAVAIGLARAGAHVVVVGRSQAKVDAALTKLADASGRMTAKGVVCDPGTAQGCRELIEAQPHADILVTIWVSTAPRNSSISMTPCGSTSFR